MRGLNIIRKDRTTKSEEQLAALKKAKKDPNTIKLYLNVQINSAIPFTHKGFQPQW